MRLTAAEHDRLQIYAVAAFAREALARGQRLSAPEAVAVIADEVHWAARMGSDYAGAEEAGRSALRPDEVLPGVPDLLAEIRVEPLFEEGLRLVVLHWPLGPPRAGFGAVDVASPDADIPSSPNRRLDVEVVNTSAHPVRISSHLPFQHANTRLLFDRAAVTGWRLDLPAGQSTRWAPGERRTVTLVEADSAGADVTM